MKQNARTTFFAILFVCKSKFCLKVLSTSTRSWKGGEDLIVKKNRKHRKLSSSFVFFFFCNSVILGIESLTFYLNIINMVSLKVEVINKWSRLAGFWPFKAKLVNLQLYEYHWYVLNIFRIFPLQSV